MPAETNKIKILIIEDDPAVHNPIQLLFNHYEYEVRVAATLADGVRAMVFNPDVIILDIQLPDGDGLKLLEQFRLKGMPNKVFILSGDNRPETQRRVRRLVPEKIFSKPFNFFEILDSVRTAIGKCEAATTTAKSLLD